MLHGNRTYLLMDDDGQIKEAHSISAGLDYPGIGPEHSWLNDVGRVTFLSATDDEALNAFQLLSKLEGIIPALEPAHAIAKVLDLAPRKPKDHLMVVNLSGRGDKDLAAVAEHLGGKSDEENRILLFFLWLETKEWVQFVGSFVLVMIGTVNVRMAAMRERKVSDAMTTRIDRRFAALKQERRAALVTFVMAGDPDPDTALAIVKALPAAGADVIELGMPFTDPMADGPAIQAAGLRALKAGQTLKKTLDLVRAFRAGDDATPIVLMGYYNPIYIYGVERFLADAKAAGVDGLIVVDLPPEEDDGAVPAGAQGGPQLHPPRDADHRRQAAAGGAREHVGLRLLRLDHRHHGRGDARRDQGRRRRSPASSAIPIFRSRSASACGRRSTRARSRRAPTAWWSARRWSMAVRTSLDAAGKATARTVPAVAGLVGELAEGVRGARPAAAE